MNNFAWKKSYWLLDYVDLICFFFHALYINYVNEFLALIRQKNLVKKFILVNLV